MTKIAMACIGLMMATTAFCVPKPTVKSFTDMTPEQRQRLREARMRQTGGILVIQGSGHLAVINSQKQFVATELTNVVSQIEKFTQGGLPVKFVDAPFSISSARAEREKSGAGACVFLIDDASLPISLVAMEESWGFVNVAALRQDSPSEAKLAARFRKEFVRVSSVIFGGIKSQYKISPLQSVTSLRELDKTVGCDYATDTLMSMASHSSEIGVIRTQRLTYLEACKRGLAPAPTNDMQKAIWDKINVLPKNPMRIQFDAKAGW